MEKIYSKARAKVNLTLEVLGKREDGYHNIRSIFQKINLYDEIWIQKTNTNTIEIKTNQEELNNPENIIYQAYQYLKKKYEKITGICVKLHKKIPMQAGLAGGSTDGASFLRAMNQLFDLKLEKEEIEAIGKSLGADVVPCLYQQAVMAQGIGDIITPIDTTFQYYMVIVKPKLACSTKKMYQRIDVQKTINQPNTCDKMIQALEQNQLEGVAKNLYNRFEEAMEENDRIEIEKIKKELIQQGAIRK